MLALRVPILALVTAALASIPAPTGAQVDVQRSFDRGDWKVSVRRDLWNDEIDAIAQSNFVPISPGTGYAGIALHCVDDQLAVEFHWPRQVTTSGGERSVFYIRVGRAGPVAAWLTVLQNDHSFRGVLNRSMTTITEDDLLKADEMTFGPDIGGPAAHVRTRGASEAWLAIKEVCQSARPR
ncbi:hypothetical protein [Nostoc linckia]|uniref:Uncharacterized protein n=1 Tax=Nostoc linckia z8 TaxID=1628746 RepID=A0A9Q5Z450_NOSLI|nr:hypothetical protein [Nostoc linckia]PHJ89336.1 hypothetical protein VF08_37770 [Nostoc linckia z8]